MAQRSGGEPRTPASSPLLSVRRWRLTFMIGHQGSDAQQATVIKRRTWGGALVLSGRRSRRCWNTRSMDFCQRFCNRVCQPPVQLRGVGIYSHGCKQGCFQPPRPGGVAGAGVRTRRSCGRAGGTAAPWWRGTPEVSPPSGWNEGYEPAILWGGGRADCPGLPRPHGRVLLRPLGLGSAWLGAGGLRDVAERTEYTGPHGQNGSPPRS